MIETEITVDPVEIYSDNSSIQQLLNIAELLSDNITLPPFRGRVNLSQGKWVMNIDDRAFIRKQKLFILAAIELSHRAISLMERDIKECDSYLNGTSTGQWR